MVFLHGGELNLGIPHRRGRDRGDRTTARGWYAESSDHNGDRQHFVDNKSVKFLDILTTIPDTSSGFYTPVFEENADDCIRLFSQFRVQLTDDCIDRLITNWMLLSANFPRHLCPVMDTILNYLIQFASLKSETHTEIVLRLLFEEWITNVGICFENFIHMWIRNVEICFPVCI